MFLVKSFRSEFTSFSGISPGFLWEVLGNSCRSHLRTMAAVPIEFLQEFLKSSTRIYPGIHPDVPYINTHESYLEIRFLRKFLQEILVIFSRSFSGNPPGSPEIIPGASQEFPKISREYSQGISTFISNKLLKDSRESSGISKKLQQKFSRNFRRCIEDTLGRFPQDFLEKCQRNSWINFR